MPRYALTVTLSALVVVAQGAVADELPAPQAETEVEVPPAELPPNPPEREFLFTVDPSLPAPGHVVVTAGMGNVTKTGEERPAGAGTIVPTVGAEVGLLPRLSLYGEGGAAFVQTGNPDGIASPINFEGGAHILLTNPNSQTWRASLRPSYIYDFNGSSTVNLTATGAWNHQAVRVAASLMGSHTFQATADPFDIQATVGASYALPLGFRVGAEGVFEDLEGTQAGAEGGTSAFAGPTLGWEWSRFQIVAGPAFGVGPSFDGAIGGSYTFLFRAAASLRL